MSSITKRQAYWSEQNTQWESRGLAQQKFCVQQGLVYKQFVYWRGRLNKNKSGTAEPKLLKVSTAPTHQPFQAIDEQGTCLEVTLPTGIKLYIKSDADISKACTFIHLLSGGR